MSSPPRRECHSDRIAAGALTAPQRPAYHRFARETRLETRQGGNMRKSQKVAATLGGIIVASTVVFGVELVSAPSAQATCSGNFFSRTCTQVDTPHNNWTTTTTSTFNGFFRPRTTTTTVTNPSGKQPPGQNK